VSSLLLLRLFHQSLPYLKSNIRELAADSTEKAAFEKVSLSFYFLAALVLLSQGI